jgi:hypothetical protein
MSEPSRLSNHAVLMLVWHLGTLVSGQKTASPSLEQDMKALHTPSGLLAAFLERSRHNGLYFMDCITDRIVQNRRQSHFST